MSERKVANLIDFDLCFCPRSADVMAITKIQFVRKAREACG
jgi:hypothetical protein